MLDNSHWWACLPLAWANIRRWRWHSCHQTGVPLRNSPVSILPAPAKRRVLLATLRSSRSFSNVYVNSRMQPRSKLNCWLGARPVQNSVAFLSSCRHRWRQTSFSDDNHDILDDIVIGFDLSKPPGRGAIPAGLYNFGVRATEVYHAWASTTVIFL